MTTRPKGYQTDPDRAQNDETRLSAGIVTNPAEQAWEALGLAEFPIVTTAAKRPPIDTLEFEETTTRRGQTISRRWAMVASSEYGLPRLYDLDLYVAVLILAERHGYEQRLIKTTLHELCTIPGLTPGGTTYQRIKSGTRRFIHTGYSAKGVFWPEGSTQPVELEEWHILAEARLLPSYQDPAIKDGLPPSYMLLGQKFLQILKRETRKPINLGIWRQLGSDLSKALFHYIDTALYNRDRFEIGLKRLGNHIGQTARYAPSQAQRLYRPYLQRFVDLGFLHSFSFEKGRSKTDPMKLLVFPGKNARRSAGRAVQVPLPQDEAENVSQGHRRRNSGRLDPAVAEICRYFHDVRHGTTKQRFSQSEREAAAEILSVAEGDLDRGRFVIDYALHQAARTEFNLQHLKGVLLNSYPERAVAAYEQDRIAKAKAEEEQEQLRRWQEQRSKLEQQARADWAELGDEERERYLDAAKDSLRDHLRRVDADRAKQWIQETARGKFVREHVATAVNRQRKP